MKVLESAVWLVIGTVLLTFCSLSFLVFPRPLTVGNPGLLVEALFVGGLVFAWLGARGLYRIHRTLRGQTVKASAHIASA